MQDLSRLNSLITKASAIAGSDKALAAKLGTSSQVVSNQRHQSLQIKPCVFQSRFVNANRSSDRTTCDRVQP